MPVSATDLSALAASHDIINLGMLADAVRRERHGVRTTFVRVADVSSEVGAPMSWPTATGEVRIVGVPPTHAAALARVREVKQQAGAVPVSAFSLADLEQLAAREQTDVASHSRRSARRGPGSRRRRAVRSAAEPAAMRRRSQHRRPRARPPDDSSTAGRRMRCRCSGRLPSSNTTSRSSSRLRRCRAGSIPPCPPPGTTT